MKQAELFAEVLRDYVRRSAYRPSQLARLSGIPPRTIAHWLEGLVRRPRTWQDVARLAQALRLNRLETDTLLTAAGYPLLEQLRGYAGDETEQALLAFWTEVSPLPAKAVPFQIIPDLPTFVGREALLARLRGLLLADWAAASPSR
jgi:hypothetical protein